MFLLTTTGFVFEKDHWVRFLREKNITKVLLIRLVKKAGPFDWSRNYQTVLNEITSNILYTKGEQDVLVKAFTTVSSLLDLLKQLYIEFEYHELLENEPELTRTAYLSKIISQQPMQGIIDIAPGERSVIVSFFKLAQYFPEKITEFGLNDFSKNIFIPIIMPFLDPDPDQRQKTTFKDILSMFMPAKAMDYTEVVAKVIYQSIDIQEKIPVLASSHLKNRLSSMVKAKPGKPKLLMASDDLKDKRKFSYQLSEYGLFILFINYLRYKLDQKPEEEKWFASCRNCFSNVSFTNCSQITIYNPFSK